MITHFANLQINTLSVQGVKQLYHDQLCFPIIHESDCEIQFQPTENFILSFKETTVPLSPVHFAFQVPFSEFENAVQGLIKNGISLLKWPDGRVVDDFETGKNVYFRDGDGNLLEIIAHSYVNEGILPPNGALKILYLREIGFPVDSVVNFRELLVELLELKLDKVSENFTFAIGGTAHCVITSLTRKWIPISMTALPPKISVGLGVSNTIFIDKIKHNLHAKNINYYINEAGILTFNLSDYAFNVYLTKFADDVPRLLNLPCSRIT